MAEKVAVYIRVSTDSEDQLNSLAYQRSYFEDFTKDNGYELVEIYADEGITGTSWKKRNAFKRMISAAGLDVFRVGSEEFMKVANREPKFTRILVKDISRFSRGNDAAMVLDKLRSRGVFVDFITAGLSTQEVGSDMFLRFLSALAEGESKDRSVKTLFGKRQAAKAGRMNLTKDAAYGFVKTGTDTIEIVEEEAAVVREIYRMYVEEGKGARLISQELTERGIMARIGRPFSTSTLKRILSNPMYRGALVRGRWATSVFSGRNSAAERPISEWHIHDEHHAAIVTDELFERAQEIRKGKVNSANRRGVKPAVGKYAKKIICGKCGAFYVQNKETKTGRTYLLCGNKKKGGVKVCASPNIFIDRMDAVMDEVATKDIAAAFDKERQDMIDMITLFVRDPLVKRIGAEDTADITEIERELSEVREQEKRVLGLYIAGSFDVSTLDVQKARIDADMERLSSALREARKTTADLEAEVGRIDALCDELRAKRFDANIAVLDSVTVIGDQQILMVKFAFKAILRDVETVIDNVELENLWSMLKQDHRVFTFPL